MQQPTSKLSGRKFRFNWGISIFTALLFPVLISFGLWQLDREQQKSTLQRQYEARVSAVPRDETEIDWSSSDLGWIPVRATGRFDSAHQFLLDNRILNSKVGYEVITPFVTSNGTILVNRGWIGQGQSRSDIPELGVSEVVTEITGHIYVPDGETFVLGSDEFDRESWPALIQRINVEQLADRLATVDVKPFIVRLESGSAGVLETNWAAINMRPETHRAYAVQWFTMAAVLLILYLLFSFRHPEN